MSNHILLEPPGEPFVRVEGGKILVHIPMRFKRASGRKEIIFAEPRQDDAALSPSAQRPLAIAVARAHRWLARLEDGTFGSVAELAEEVGLDPSYVSRVLALTTLAPAIVEAVLRGDEGPDVSLTAITANQPLDWMQQRPVGRSAW